MSNVNHPSHYSNGEIECIDAMLSAFGYEDTMAFCKLNAMKYIWREQNKNGKEDMSKAKWYIEKWLELSEKMMNDDLDDFFEYHSCAGCKYLADENSEWCESNCRYGVPPEDKRFDELPSMYEKE